MHIRHKPSCPHGLKFLVRTRVKHITQAALSSSPARFVVPSSISKHSFKSSYCLNMNSFRSLLPGGIEKGILPQFLGTSTKGVWELPSSAMNIYFVNYNIVFGKIANNEIKILFLPKVGWLFPALARVIGPLFWFWTTSDASSSWSDSGLFWPIGPRSISSSSSSSSSSSPSGICMLKLWTVDSKNCQAESLPKSYFDVCRRIDASKSNHFSFTGHEIATFLLALAKSSVAVDAMDWSVSVQWFWY